MTGRAARIEKLHVVYRRPEGCPTCISWGGVVFVVDGTRHVRALDVGTGRDLWRFGDADAAWRCYDASDGVVDASDGVVYFTAKHTLLALDAASGQERWRFRNLRSNQFRPSVLVRGGTVYALGADGFLHAFEAGGGRERWSSPVRGGADLCALPLTDNVAYDGFDMFGLSVLDAATGAECWYFAEADTYYGPVAAGGTVFVADRYFGGEVVALDVATGVRRWRFTPTNEWEVHPVAAMPGTVFVQEPWAPTLYAVDADTGGARWHTEGWYLTTVTDLAYLVAPDRSMRVVDVASGVERSRLSADVLDITAGLAGIDPRYETSNYDQAGKPDIPAGAPRAVDIVGSNLVIMTDRGAPEEVSHARRTESAA
jgi:outer membrane protein assembly factor BamB